MIRLLHMPYAQTKMQIVLAVVAAVLIAVGAVVPAMGAYMFTVIDPDNDSFEFGITYQRNVIFEYPIGSPLFESLNGTQWHLKGIVGSDDLGVQKLMDDLNAKIRADGSVSAIQNLTVDYDIQFNGRDTLTLVDYVVTLKGEITDHIIQQDQDRTLIDLGWRGLSIDEPVVIDGVDINIPLNTFQARVPIVYDTMSGTEAAELLSIPVINADRILEQDINTWQTLFDPAGIIEDAKQFGISGELAGKVLSPWAMGVSSFQEGIHKEKEERVTVSEYIVRVTVFANSAVISIIGHGVLDNLDGLDVVSITDEAPAGVSRTATGDFPIYIIYGMAGVAAVGGVIFYIISHRRHKKDEHHRIASSKGVTEPTCSCGHSTDTDAKCGCYKQGYCLCDATCECAGQICRDHVSDIHD